MGSQLSKHYDVDKDVHWLGGPSNVWRIHNATKKGPSKAPVSVFIFDKKQIKSKSDTASVWEFLNKDADELARIKHPNVLNLEQQPLEDGKTLVLITEPVDYSLAFLLDNYKMKNSLPGELESKLIMLELLEAIHFLHNTAKLSHISISPENVYITKNGKVKIAGFSCWTGIKDTASTINFSYSTFGDNNFALAPNLRFTAPEIVDENVATPQADVFSLGCVLYYLLNIDKGEDAFLLKMTNQYSTTQHSKACQDLRFQMDSKFSHLPYELKALFKSALDTNRNSRGSVNSFVENGFFQDPLIKTIRYLENIEHKEHHNVVQFLTGLSRILEKFDKRSCIRKILPLMLKWVDKGDLSVLILPPVIKLLKQKDFITKEAFQEFVWPPISKLCQVGEMPAQALFILVDNTEMFSEFISASDFQGVYLPLLLKALECGVHKLQHLGMTKIPFLSKKIEYATFKNQIMPRFLMIITEASIPLKLKEIGWEVLIKILHILDKNFLRDNILKALQLLRDKINEPIICMHLLTLYSGIAGALTPEDIGNKILPGLIPMLISASFTKSQFNKLISTIRTLIDELEKHRLKDLDEMDPLDQSDPTRGASTQKDIFAGLSGNFDDPNSALPPREDEGDFDFLSVIEGTSKKQVPKPSGIESANGKSPKKDPFSDFSGAPSFPSKPAPPPKNDIFKGTGLHSTSIAPPKKVENMALGNKPQGLGFDPFDTSGPMKPLSKPSHSTSGIKGGDLFSDIDPFNNNKPSTSDPFCNFGSSRPVQSSTGITSTTINMTSGFKSLSDGFDPFADALTEERKEEPSGFGGFNSGINFTSDFSGSTQPKKLSTNTFGVSSDPFSGLSGAPKNNLPKGSDNSGFNFGGSAAKNSSTAGFGGSGATKSSIGGFGRGSSTTGGSAFGSVSQSKPSQFSSSNFGTMGSSNEGFGGSTFQSQPPSNNPPGTFSFPDGIDMNAPMDQTTMNQMMQMMQNFTAQMNTGGTQPQWGGNQSQNQNTSGSKPPFNNKGIFD
jgi:SCY1-like protein 2